MLRAQSSFHLRFVLSVCTLSAAGCGLLHGDPLCPRNQSCCCKDDPRVGSCDYGCGCWDELCGEIVVVSESGCHGCRPCASAIADDIESHGACARIIGKHELNLAARDIFAGRNAGCWSGPVTIVGCRGGVDEAIRLCRILETVDIGVDQLILVGNTCCTYVPCNVASVVNLYYSGGGLLCGSGKEICPEGECTQVVNQDLTLCGEDPGLGSCSECARELAVQYALGDGK